MLGPINKIKKKLAVLQVYEIVLLSFTLVIFNHISIVKFKNENLEPSSVKSQLSRKHGMQSLGKVPSTRRPPANLPSLKTETGQDPNTK